MTVTMEHKRKSSWDSKVMTIYIFKHQLFIRNQKTSRIIEKKMEIPTKQTRSESSFGFTTLQLFFKPSGFKATLIFCTMERNAEMERNIELQQ